MSTDGASASGASFHDARVAAQAGDRRTTFKIALQQVLFGLLPLMLLVLLLRSILEDTNSMLAVDFRNEYYVGAQRLIRGGEIYAWTHHQIDGGIAFPYPALTAVLFVPFTLASLNAACVSFTFVCVALVPLTLWVLAIRDWRVYCVALIWAPVFGAWQTGNETMLLGVIIALVWRYRDNPVGAGLLTAVAISLKPFVWPLALWLLATRRWRASAWSLIFGIVVNLLAWSIAGFAQFRAYVRLSSTVADALWRSGYSVLAAAHHLGLSRGAGESLQIVACAALIGAIVYIGWQGGERRSLTLTVLLMLVASPLVWSHYCALLLIPLALARPRFHWLWGLPIFMWYCPGGGKVTNSQEAVLWLLAGTMFVYMTRSSKVPLPTSGRSSPRGWSVEARTYSPPLTPENGAAVAAVSRGDLIHPRTALTH